MARLLGVGGLGVAVTAAAAMAAIATIAPAAKADDTAKTTLAAKIDEPREAMPTTCGADAALGKTKLCVPPQDYAKRLCGGIYPEVALGFFAKGTPWSRVYLAGDVDAWNASGGLTHRARLAFDEEVIVLARHAPGGSGGIVMTGAQASFDVLRWDGTCVSVMEGEITTARPPRPKPAPVPFGRLEETTRRALLGSAKVKSTYEDLGRACSSQEKPEEKKRCDKADAAFAQAIADFVRGGGALPTPARRP